MAWKETTAMEQKIEFITEWRSGAYSITELCRQFNISRPTAYKYINRYEQEGLQGLYEKTRSHSNHPNKTKDYIEDSIVALRKKHPRWGAEKIWMLLQRQSLVSG
jgi:transposase